MYPTRYGTARNILPLVSALGWGMVAIGVGTVVIALTGQSYMGAALALPGLGVVIGGLFCVVNVQIAQAVLDIADNSHRALAVPGGETPSAAPPAASPYMAPAGAPPETSSYMGETIEKINHRYIWNGQSHRTLGKAKAAIKAAHQP
ncbi:hypothetical protein [Pseudooceanicola aestuarii]|uniref:hypothetical protein n=1 Tax=Pseudooceanicola aestuarii TaxID=2697319 RepID=UPI0013D304DA|nr:hypothetical protein [Pseudooceanicola aestuarii]